MLEMPRQNQRCHDDGAGRVADPPGEPGITEVLPRDIAAQGQAQRAEPSADPELTTALREGGEAAEKVTLSYTCRPLSYT